MNNWAKLKQKENKRKTKHGCCSITTDMTAMEDRVMAIKEKLKKTFTSPLEFTLKTSTLLTDVVFHAF